MDSGFRNLFGPRTGNGSTATVNGMPADKQEQILNRMEEIISNALMGRQEMFRKMFDPRRDIDDECGFPKGEVNQATYDELYARDAIAARVVEVLPEESWQTTPTVYETEATDDITQFEDTWDNLAKQLRSDSLYQDEEGNPIWEYLCRADKLSGIGQYGIILLGLDDGLPMNMPVATWEDRQPDNTYPGAVGGYGVTMGDTGGQGKDKNGIQAGGPGKKDNKKGTPGTGKKSNGRDVIPDKEDQNPLGSLDKTPPNYPYSGTPESLTGEGPNPTGVGTDAQYQSQFTSYNPAVTTGDEKPDANDRDSSKHSGQIQKPKGIFDIIDGRGDESDEGDTYGKTESDNDTDSVDQNNGLTPEEIQLIVKGIETDGPLDPAEIASVMGETDDNGDQVDPETGEVLSSPGEYAGPKYEPRVNLLYMRVFPQAQAQITQYERDIHSPRFGKPTMYLVTFNDPRQQHSGTGLPIASQNVHWTRVIHIADNLMSSEVFGVERMRPVLNNLLSLRKVSYGSGEMYWKGAFPGYSLETNPQLGGDVSINADQTRDMMEDYANGLQRFLLLMGMQAKSLAPQVVDPTPQIAVQIEAICIKLGIPVRVFKGSERGELASSQDDSAWNDRLKKRQQQYITPRIIVPFVDRLINIGILPRPKGFSVAWKDLDSLSETDKATNANTITTALGAYISGQVESLITPKDFFVHVLQFTDEQAESIIEASKAEQDLKDQEQAALVDEHGMIPTPPEGFQHDPENLPEGIAPDGSPLPPAPIIAGGHPGMPNAGGPPMPPGASGKPPTAPTGGKPPAPGGIDPGKFGEKLKPNPTIPGKPPVPGKPKPAFGQKPPKPVANTLLTLMLKMNERIDRLVENNSNQPRDEKGRFGSVSVSSVDSVTVSSAHKTLTDLHTRFPVLNSVPPPHLEVVDKIDLSSSIGLADPKAELYGGYTHGQGKITLNENIPDTGELTVGGPTVGYSKEIAFRHEYGHHVQDTLPRPIDPDTGRQMSWQRIARPYLSANPDTMQKQTPLSVISNYATLSHKEAFAESFAVYTDPRYTRGMLPGPVERYLDLLLTGKAEGTVHNYDPDQPRDALGRFGSGGGAGKLEDGGTTKAPIAQFPHALPVDAPPMAIPVNIPQAIPVHAPSTGVNPGNVHPSNRDSHSPNSALPERADSQAKAASLKQKALDLFTKGKAKMTGAGKAVYDKLPKPVQKVVDVGQAIEHGLEGAYHTGRKLAQEVARERGGDDKHVERVARWTGLADGVMRWTANIPVMHEALHVVAHIGGPVGFLGAKAGYYVPVASLAYIGYSMAQEARAKRNPFAMINRARKSMQAKAAKEKKSGHGH